MQKYVLEAKNIVKRFPGVIALKNVSLNVKNGEILGLIGENGAGKSTLLKIINGVYPFGSYEGELLLNGKTVKYKNSTDALKNGIGFVPQEINVMDELTVAENIYSGHLDEKGKKFISVTRIINRAKAFLAENGFELDASALVSTLSIGHKQLLMIAKALSWNPEVMVLDEPTTALSQADVDKLFHIVKKMKENGKSIIFVTHKLDEIFQLTDRVTILRDGETIRTYEKKDYDEGKIIHGMVGRELTTLYPERISKIGEEILKVENIVVPHERIEGKNLVDGVSFSLRKGECLGLVGLVDRKSTRLNSSHFQGL